MSSAEHPHLRVRPVDGVAVVNFVAAEIIFEQALVDSIGAGLTELVDNQSFRKIVLDFQGVNYVCSTMLATLMQFDRKLRKAGGRLRFCGMGPTLQDVLRVSHLDRVFDVDVDEAAGISKLNG